MKLIIFDCDGTIADSQHMIVAAMDEAFHANGLPPPPRDQVVSVIGLSLVEAVSGLLPDAHQERSEEIAEAYKQAFHGLRAAGEKQEPLFDGMRDAILKLKSEGAVLGIATGKSVRGVKHLIDREKLGGQFTTVQTADTNPSKPHPAMIELAMAETGAEPHETVMIGDTTFDMIMARNAGVASIGVSWGYHPAEALREAGADVIVDDPAAMLAAIAELLEGTAEVQPA